MAHVTYVPDGRLGVGEAAVRLALAEPVEVAAGVELGEEAGPARSDSATAGQEGVVDGLEDLALLAAAFQLPAVIR